MSETVMSLLMWEIFIREWERTQKRSSNKPLTEMWWNVGKERQGRSWLLHAAWNKWGQVIIKAPKSGGGECGKVLDFRREKPGEWVVGCEEGRDAHRTRFQLSFRKMGEYGMFTYEDGVKFELKQKPALSPKEKSLVWILLRPHYWVTNTHITQISTCAGPSLSLWVCYCYSLILQFKSKIHSSCLRMCFCWCECEALFRQYHSVLHCLFCLCSSFCSFSLYLPSCWEHCF